MAYDPKKKVDLDKLRSISVSGSAMPTRSNVRQISETEERWSKDFPAYRRLRQDGLQPRTSDGAADLEARGAEAHEIEGRPDPKHVEQASEQLGVDLTKPAE